MDECEAILEFWFGALDADGCADAEHVQRWWKKDPAFDDLIRKRFGMVHEAVARGERESWLESTRGRLGYVLLLDQFSRNMFRNSARMFEYDAQALRAALPAIDRGEERALAFDERGFMYMPLVHSEDLAQQERCVALFAAFCAELDGERRERAANALRYAERHREIVRRFGRFPHRNSLLGRTSTAEEIEFLTQPGSAF